MSRFYKILTWVVFTLLIINLCLNSSRLNLFMWSKVAKVLKQHHTRMGAMDRRIDARIHNERNLAKLLSTIKLNGNGRFIKEELCLPQTKKKY